MEDIKTATVRMFTSAKDWPNIVLPVKRKHPLEHSRDSFPQMGYMIEPAKGGQGPVTIFIGNMFNINPSQDTPCHYKDIAAAVQAGWRVD